MTVRELPAPLAADGWRLGVIFALDDSGDPSWLPGLVRGDLTACREANGPRWILRTRSSGYRIAWAADVPSLRQLVRALEPAADWYAVSIKGIDDALRLRVRDAVDRLGAELDTIGAGE